MKKYTNFKNKVSFDTIIIFFGNFFRNLRKIIFLHNGEQDILVCIRACRIRIYY